MPFEEMLDALNHTNVSHPGKVGAERRHERSFIAKADHGGETSGAPALFEELHGVKEILVHLAMVSEHRFDTHQVLVCVVVRR